MRGEAFLAAHRSGGRSPGTYNPKVEKRGFRTYVQVGIVLTVGQTATEDVKMEFRAVTQQVTVTAGADMLKAATASEGMTDALTKCAYSLVFLRNMEGGR